ncbi:quinone-dependent dihydroorotate dehydrogenase [Nitratireductor thuwali]|uniref:Dihydroorotate dehydrogenase (quinone) n=1 Tax=Nitratireductor thuwali TaxID=2267699 RepID=A0ABY5MJA7_9HYPH|nr:Dihydroorotate dehydrogenase (quinone) [Nitratireductor thuwali]
MKGSIGRVGRSVLFALDPERAHTLSIAALKSGFLPCPPVLPTPRLAVNVAGLDFPNPVGMAAGFDKNAEVPDALLRLGFGFAECGTVTPRPQAGNEKPRIFRLPEDEAVINRLGFNNEGLERVVARLRERGTRPGIVGINIGTNRDSDDRIAAYEEGVRAFAGLSSYLTVNISSPNTKGLRDLQHRKSLAELLDRVTEARDSEADRLGRRIPVFLKIAPDLPDEGFVDVAEEVARYRVDGLVVSNTTLSRAGLKGPARGEAGGLSGKPLFHRSTIALARMRKLVGPALPIIGVGGIDSAASAMEKIRAGADLVQLYTGMIYAGPGLPARIVTEMDSFAHSAGLSSIRQLRDTHVDRWAERPLGG